MQRYLIPGIGIVDVMTDLKVMPGPNGHGSHVVGTAKAWVRRLDNSFFPSLTGGLPSLTTNLERGSDGIVHFTNLQLYSPKLRLSGAGAAAQRRHFPHHRRRAAGEIRSAEAGARRADRAAAAQHPPRSSERHARSHAPCTSRSIRSPAGYNYKASGGSRIGPFTSNGQILLPHDAPTVIAIAALDANGAHATGELKSMPGGFLGRLTLANGTLGGTLDFAPAGQDQRIDAHLTATNASFPGAFSVRTGRADGTIILADDKTTVEGSVDARGVVGRGQWRWRGSPPMRTWSMARARSAPPSPAGAAPPSPSRPSPTSLPTDPAHRQRQDRATSRWCSTSRRC